jgi:DNA-directed RNA polymerase subunit L
MDTQVRRKLITAFALISGVLVVGALFAQQYFTYQSETQALSGAVRWVDHQLKRVEALERQPGKLDETVKGIEEKLFRQRLKVPPTLNVERFLEHFSTRAGGFGVEVKESHAESVSLDFYDQATLKLKLAGDDKDIRAFLKELSTGERLTQHNVSHCANKECSVEISIYSVPEPEEEPSSMFDIQACGEFNSKVWLWPFASRIQDRCEELKARCEEMQRQRSTIRSTEELMAKLRFSQFIGEVIKHLETIKTPID